MGQAQFSIGQEVRFKEVSKKYARKGGVIKGIVDCYNLNKELCKDFQMVMWYVKDILLIHYNHKDIEP